MAAAVQPSCLWNSQETFYKTCRNRLYLPNPYVSPGRSQSAVTSFRGKIWVAGGCDAWNPLSSVEIYDPETNSWRLGPPMGTPRLFFDNNWLIYLYY